MLTIDIQGIPEMQRALEALMQRAMPALAHAIHEEAERILQASYPLVPVDTGLLLSTGLVTPLVAQGQEVETEIRYGGGGLAPYSIIVHEISPDTNHPNGGQHHFLSEPFYAATGGVLNRLAPDVWRGLGG